MAYKDLCPEAYWSTAHRALLPPGQVGGHSLAAQMHTTDLLKGAQGKRSILHAGKLSQAICFQGNQIHKFPGSAPAWV